MDWLLFFLFIIGSILVMVLLWFIFNHIFAPKKDDSIYSFGSDSPGIGRWVPPEELERRRKRMDEQFPIEETEDG